MLFQYCTTLWHETKVSGRILVISNPLYLYEFQLLLWAFFPPTAGQQELCSTPIAIASSSRSSTEGSRSVVFSTCSRLHVMQVRGYDYA